MSAPEPLAQIAAELAACARCDLRIGARHAVPGIGDPHAEIMLIGEAPSSFDDQRGRPFSGPSGTFLDELLAVAGLERAQVYLTNIVKHRVPERREVFPGEAAACAGYLTREIAAVRPILIVALGRAAAARFIPRVRISQMHGQLHPAGTYLVLAMYNPAAGLHRAELRQTIVDDFARALPAALAEARRRATAGQLGVAPPDDDAPQQMSLF
ncbi:MAG TPA: uracil-DNA glycosylase [Ktedonobacterales bacterium]|jgi:DNA polymerase|nr:uracil-DNA glycosylase [Ktedonobacterales bacterium]